MKMKLALLVVVFGLSGCATQPVLAPSTDIYRKMSCDFAYGSLGFHEGNEVITATTAGTLSLLVEASQRCSSGGIKIVGLSDTADDALSLSPPIWR